VGVAVAVMPRLFVAIVTAGRDELVQNGRQVMLQSRLELDGGDRCRTSDVEHVGGPRLNCRLGDDGGNLPGQIVHVAVAIRRNRNLFLMRHNGLFSSKVMVSDALQKADRKWLPWSFSVLPWLAAACALMIASLAQAKAPGTVRVLDVSRVQAGRPASAAVLTLSVPSHVQRVYCEVLVVGASTGGVAAALAAAQGGHTTCLTEETSWIGGQITAQGISAFDSNRYIETTGAASSFENLRHAIRRYYKTHERLSPRGLSEEFFNPGNCWVSALCFEAPVALKILNSMFAPYEARGLLRVYLRTKAVRVERQGRRIVAVLAYGFESHHWSQFLPKVVLDATDTGELLPLTHLHYVTGAEPRSMTGEPDAPPGGGDPGDIQSFTYTFVLAYAPGHGRPIAQPAEYLKYSRLQHYTLRVNYGHGKFLTFRMFETAPGTPGSFWDYRRLIDARNFVDAPREVSLVNWPGNDYCDPRILSPDPLETAQALRAAKLAALGFAYWLQTEAPHEDKRRKGYAGLSLQQSLLGSEDALSQFPYIRESRRIRALKTIREQDISSAYQKGSRAALFPDSVGIGLYPIDIHSCSRKDFLSGTKPFQIPLGALIPADSDNLLAASKDLGTTHITNGAYRLHPIEWAIGEAAGTLADFALDHGRTPSTVDRNVKLTALLQLALLRQGDPVFWFDDVPLGSMSFEAIQFLAARNIFGPNGKNLHFNPGNPVTAGEAAQAVEHALHSGHAHRAGTAPTSPNATTASIALRRLASKGYFSPGSALRASSNAPMVWRELWPACRKFKIPAPRGQRAESVVTRAAFAHWLEKVVVKY
jgi:hypothetical protein